MASQGNVPSAKRSVPLTPLLGSTYKHLEYASTKNLIEFFALFSLLGRCCKVRNFLSHDGYFFGEGIFDWVRTALFIKCHFFPMTQSHTTV